MTRRPLLILWHSRTGAAQALAEAAARGAGEAGRMIRARDAKPDDMLSAQAYLFVCPENLGSMTGEMKELFDRAYYPLLGHIEGRAYATVIAAGSDGGGAQAQIDRIVTGWRLRRVTERMIVNVDAQTPEAILKPKIVPTDTLVKCEQLGAALVEGLAHGIF